MKYLLLIIATCIGSMMFSQQVIVFSKTEKCFLNVKDSPCKPKGKEKLDFLADFQHVNFQDTAGLNKMKLITPPLEWGKKVNDDTNGEIVFFSSFANGFITDLSLFNLLPDHNYLLTLNGNPKLAGNDLLPDTVPNLSIERYYDFLSIKTDSHGNYHARIGIYLKHGNYGVRLYVKDTDGYKIVLYHDYFNFTVR